MKQQTAVEWLWNLSQTKELEASDFEQALSMEKEQILKAIDYCRDKYIDSENYYNETYNTDTP